MIIFKRPAKLLSLVRTLAFASVLSFMTSLMPRPAVAQVEPTFPMAELPPEQKPEWGEFTPGKGVLLSRTKLGELSLGGYLLYRYLNQTPQNQNFTTNTGVQQPVTTRNDINLHRVMIWVNGWLYDPRLTYQGMVWTVRTTEQVAVIGSLNYEFTRMFQLGAGIAGNPGIRTLNSQHPYFLGTDRHMAEEFFRPGFSSSIWLKGELLPTVRYRVNVANSLSQLGVSANEDPRDLAYGVTMWWMPTTGEFGPKDGFGDYEQHERIATKVGFSAIRSREDRFAQPDIDTPENTQIRLTDGQLFFATGAIAPGLTINRSDFSLVSIDAAMKHRGLFLFAEAYYRLLNRFDATGPVPVNSITDRGYELQASYYIIPKRAEVYATHSYIFGQLNDSWEAGIGANYYPFDTRNFRLNTLVTHIERSAAGSSFGYYAAGQTGTIVIAAADIYF